MRSALVLSLVVGIPLLLEAQGSPLHPCVPTTALDTSLTRLELPEGTGWLRVPGAGSTKGSLPRGLTLILEDSTLIDVWLTSEPATGFASSAGARPTNFAFCDFSVHGRPGTVTRVTLVMPGADSVFVGVLNLTLDPDHALNVAVSTATADSRDRMLGLLAGNLEFRGYAK